MLTYMMSFINSRNTTTRCQGICMKWHTVTNTKNWNQKYGFCANKDGRYKTSMQCLKLYLIEITTSKIFHKPVYRVPFIAQKLSTFRIQNNIKWSWIYLDVSTTRSLPLQQHQQHTYIINICKEIMQSLYSSGATWIHMNGNQTYEHETKMVQLKSILDVEDVNWTLLNWKIMNLI